MVWRRRRRTLWRKIGVGFSRAERIYGRAVFQIELSRTRAYKRTTKRRAGLTGGFSEPKTKSPRTPSTRARCRARNVYGKQNGRSCDVSLGTERRRLTRVRNYVRTGTARDLHGPGACLLLTEFNQPITRVIAPPIDTRAPETTPFVRGPVRIHRVFARSVFPRCFRGARAFRGKWLES